MKIVTHCHTLHSFDSSLQIPDIISELLKADVNHIIISDHDVFNLTDYEENLFKNVKITLLRGIEFTTKVGIHVIGVHPQIQKLQKDSFFWDINELLTQLERLDALIIFPHPSHETGIIGNLNLDMNKKERLLQRVVFYEKHNYRYGKTCQKDIELIERFQKKACWLAGSDAHKKSEVTAFINNILNISNIHEMNAKNFQVKINHLLQKKRSTHYFLWRSIKKTAVYQYFLNLFPQTLRFKIKKVLGRY